MERRHSSEQLKALANGILIGLGGMYLMDPNRGARRRAEVRNQGVHLLHRMDDAIETTATDLRNRAKGVVAETRGRFRREDAPDAVVEARVRSELGRLVSHPSSIHVESMDGIITLRGDILEDEVAGLLRGIRGVKGVEEVRNRLREFAHPGDIPSLQGQRRRPEPRAELLQENWAPGPRLMAGALGGALIAAGGRTDGIVRALMLLMGGSVLARSITNLEMKRLTGVSAGRRAIDLQKTITVHAPVQQVFDFWSDFENLPRFMTHLREVRTMEGGRSRWTAEGPAGLSISWDAEITAFEPQRVIGWKSIGSTPVQNAGIVRFESVGPDATRVDVQMSYNPAAGALGHVIASMFGVDPKQAMDDDLVRFKSLLEDGKTTAEGREITRHEAAERRQIVTGSD